MIASVVAPTPPHQSPAATTVSAAAGPPSPAAQTPTSSRPSRLRGLSLLRRSGQNRSNPNSPPVSPPERSNLERSSGFPLLAGNVLEEQSQAATENSQSAGVISGAVPNGPTTTAITASLAIPVVPSANAPGQISVRGKKSSSNLGPESSSPASTGMARLRRAFSSQNGSKPTNGRLPSPAPGADSAAIPPSPLPTGIDEAAVQTPNEMNGAGRDGLAPDQMPTIKFIPHQDLRSSKPSLAFAATSRTLPHEDCVIRVGRYSERDGPQNPPPGVPSAAPVGFKSKVVSRKHCEFWCSQGQWYIKDIKSSSGTFLNHIRLSQPNQESRPFPINDGDVVQLGIDFKGGEEAIFRCVKIRIECNRSWQKKLNDFNMNTHKRLRELNKTTGPKDAPGQTNECSICLMSIAPCQSLFVAPCSHVWHFKCIRPMLNDHKTYPQFLCPNCRAVTDLEADIEEIEWNQEVDGQDTDEAVSTTSAQEDGQPQSKAAAADPAQQGPAELASSSPPQDDGDARLAAAVHSLDINASSIDSALHAQAAPVEIPPPSARSLRPTTPGDIAELAGHEGPMTPRNNAGPFIFDGSSSARRRAMPGVAQSLEANGISENVLLSPTS